MSNHQYVKGKPPTEEGLYIYTRKCIDGTRGYWIGYHNESFNRCGEQAEAWTKLPEYEEDEED